MAVAGRSRLTWLFSCLLNIYLPVVHAFEISPAVSTLEGYCGTHSRGFVARGGLKEPDLSQTKPNPDCNV